MTDEIKPGSTYRICEHCEKLEGAQEFSNEKHAPYCWVVIEESLRAHREWKENGK